jgi:hypothetical protein
MKEMLAFVLPPAIALAGMRISRIILGEKLEEEFKFGLRFALGLCVGMLVFTQGLLMADLIGLGLSALLAWTVFVWAIVEVALFVPRIFAGLKQIRFQVGHVWLVLLTPAVLLLWVYARLNVVDGVHEFDAAAFWLLKAKFLYLDHGKSFFDVLHTSNLAYTHMDYPWLVPGLYSLTYGALGGVDEFVVKAWPFWMMVALCGAIFSISRFWHQPHPAPIVTVVVLCYLPGTELFLGQEGATIPLLFGVCVAALFLLISFIRRSPVALAAGILSLGCCAAIKLEGLLYSILWAIPLSVYCWRRGWLRNRLAWKAALIVAVFLFPYFIVRLQKPVSYPEAHWLKDASASPVRVLRRYPQTLFIGLGNRFFNGAFFHWNSPDKEHLQYDGQWQGRNSFTGPELSVLPWLTCLLLGFTYWKKRAHRLALVALVAVLVGQILALSFIITSLGPIQADLNQVLGFSSDIMGRYFYPFFTACFLGIMAIWLLDHAATPPAVNELTRPLIESPKLEASAAD